MMMGRGIFALWWEDQDILWIDKSINLNLTETIIMTEFEYGVHETQTHFDSYGVPEFVVLQQCESDQVLRFETIWKNEFNS